MPMIPGKAGIGPNINELANGKRPLKQRVAIALKEARATGANIPSVKGEMAATPKKPRGFRSIAEYR